MKYKIGGLLLLLALPFLAGASPIACTAGSIDVSTFNATYAEGCYQQDKLYSNFVLTGVPANTFVQFTQQSLGGGVDRHIATFTGDFDALAGIFTIQYDITMYQPALLREISTVALDAQLPQLATENVTTTVTDLLTSFTYAPLVVYPGQPGNGHAELNLTSLTTTLRIVDQVDPAGGGISSFANAFTEVTVPEPASFLTAGLALLGLGLLRRRR
jgi:hypothetical protein